MGPKWIIFDNFSLNLLVTLLKVARRQVMKKDFLHFFYIYSKFHEKSIFLNGRPVQPLKGSVFDFPIMGIQFHFTDVRFTLIYF